MLVERYWLGSGLGLGSGSGAGFVLVLVLGLVLVLVLVLGLVLGLVLVLGLGLGCLLHLGELLLRMGRALHELRALALEQCLRRHQLAHLVRARARVRVRC